MVSEEVFRKLYIERKLGDVMKYEEDIEAAKRGQHVEVYYPVVTGLKDDLTGAKSDDEDLGSHGSEDTQSCCSSDDPATEKRSREKKENTSAFMRQRDESPNTKKVIL
ncbi:unnamed protein product [Soboliphyme baturini]|uniref:DUF4604 domain-containing protein n=1 Tax=Soboliphyme baturini TaxID=241478 RepID=A0A183J0S2_9BILA|nr:unnamed protein product [Soboliphyme baturini]